MGATFRVSSLSRVRAAGLVWGLERRSAPHAMRGAQGSTGQEGADEWRGTVVCKATFALAARSISLHPDQDPMIAEERAFADGSSAGLAAPPDLVPMKARVDVTLVGSAAPPAPARHVSVRLALGALDKRLDVWTDRVALPDGTLQEAPPFSAMPLVYERASAGPDLSNPIGMRMDARDPYGRTRLPNLQLGETNSTWIPGCFAPVPSGWPRRAELYAQGAPPPPAAWDGARVPEGTDPLFFNVAPHDQQLSGLEADAWLALEHVIPGLPRVGTRLPGLGSRAFVWGRPEPFALPLRLDTVCVFAARAVVTLTWRGVIPLASASEPLDVVVGLEDAQRPLTWEEVGLMRGRSAPQRSSAALPASPVSVASGTQTTAFAATPTGLSADVPFARSESAPFSGRPSAPGPAGLPFVPASSRQQEPGRESAAPPASMPVPNMASPPPSMPIPGLAPPPPSMPAPNMAPPPPSMPMPSFAPALVSPQMAESPPPVATPSAWARGDTPGYDKPIYTPVAVPADPAPMRATTTAPRSTPTDLFTLVGLDAGGMEIARKSPSFQAVFEAMEASPQDDDLDDPDLFESPEAMENQRDALELCVHAEETPIEELGRRLADHTSPDGRTSPPAVRVAGELALGFDALAELKAVLAAAGPQAGADAEALLVVETAQGYLGSPGLPGASAVTEGLTGRIVETFSGRGLAPAAALRSQAERALLTGRAFAQKTVFGAPHVRGELRGNGRSAVPVYLPRGLAASLPSSPRLAVRMVATVHPAQDPEEPQKVALRGVAIAIVKPVSALRESAGRDRGRPSSA